MTHLRGTISTRNDLQGAASFGSFTAPFGDVFIVWQGKTLLWLGLPQPQRDAAKLEQEVRQWAPKLELSHDQKGAASFGEQIIEKWRQGSIMDYRLHGTDFQKSVWKAMLAIPVGKTCTYKDIAVKIGNPAAIRAVGQAVGNNPISLLIPCHRVLPSTGGIGNYGWGAEVKKRLLEAEGALAV